MNRLSIRARIGLLVLAEVVGIIGMLLAQSVIWDVAFFALAATPLALGLGYGLSNGGVACKKSSRYRGAEKKS